MNILKKYGIVLCNVICILLMLAILVGQFIPFWNTVEDQASLMGATGRQYVHEGLYESLDAVSGGFRYQDISTQVLVITIVCALGIMLSIKNLGRARNGIWGLVVAFFGVHIWVTVPAFTLGILGKVFFALFLALFFFSFSLVILHFIAKLSGKTEDDENMWSAKGVLSAFALACAVCVVFAVYSNSIKVSYAEKLSVKVEAEKAANHQVKMLEEELAEKNALLEEIKADDSEVDSTEPEVTEPEVTEPEVTEPEATVPDDSEFGDTYLVLKKYTVQKNDNLYKICVENGVDYHKYLDLIVYINNISDPNRISVGDVLLLPHIVENE